MGRTVLGIEKGLPRILYGTLLLNWVLTALGVKFSENWSTWGESPLGQAQKCGTQGGESWPSCSPQGLVWPGLGLVLGFDDKALPRLAWWIGRLPVQVCGGFELQTVSADCKHLWGRGLGALLSWGPDSAWACLGLPSSHELLSELCPSHHVQVKGHLWWKKWSRLPLPTGTTPAVSTSSGADCFPVSPGSLPCRIPPIFSALPGHLWGAACGIHSTSLD